MIESELNNAGCVLVIWTHRSVGSEWVKNEASEAAQNGKLVPVALEKVALSLAFSRIEMAMLTDWNGEPNHPELQILYQSIDNILQRTDSHEVAVNKSKDSDKTVALAKKLRQQQPQTNGNRSSVSGYIVIASAGFLISIFLVYYYLQYSQGKVSDQVDQRIFYLILILFGISTTALVFGVMNSYAAIRGEKTGGKFILIASAVGVILIVFGGFYLPH